MKRLIPLFDRVLIQRAEAITKTKGGIVLPEKAQAKVLRGTVVATGPGSRNDVCILYISDYISRIFLHADSPEYSITYLKCLELKNFEIF